MKWFKEKETVTIKSFAEEVHALAREKGWFDDTPSVDIFVERTCNNIHDEVSELHEAWRNNKLRLPCDKADQMKASGLKPLTCGEEELADIFIRVCDSAEYLGINIEEVARTKHNYNKTRTKRHGGKRS